MHPARVDSSYLSYFSLVSDRTSVSDEYAQHYDYLHLKSGYLAVHIAFLARSVYTSNPKTYVQRRSSPPRSRQHNQLIQYLDAQIGTRAANRITDNIFHQCSPFERQPEDSLEMRIVIA
jgi:hypothetical protein